jgi:hypothetical protein
MSTGHPGVELVRQQFRTAHATWLEPTVEGMSSAQAHWRPAGEALPAGAHYAHAVVTEDHLIQGMLRGGAPLAAGDWAGKTGLSEEPPAGDWSDWARRVQIDLPQLRAYARAVYAATDDWLATLADVDLQRDTDFSAIGAGTQPMSFLVTIVLLNAVAHCGEIACLKGLQGAKGYPM